MEDLGHFRWFWWWFIGGWGRFVGAHTTVAPDKGSQTVREYAPKVV